MAAHLRRGALVHHRTGDPHEEGVQSLAGMDRQE
jgi:hypothetical protein